MTLTVTDLPALNATLNATSGVLLIAGYRYILRRRINAHRACMLAAFAVSAVFLTTYLIYHYKVGHVAFTGKGWIRPVYFVILFTHIPLAFAILPLALITLSQALRRKFDRHRRIARWTLPIWLYVSVTGVLVYWMLYHLS